VSAPLHALLVALVFGGPPQQPLIPAAAAVSPPGSTDTSPRERLWALLTAGASGGAVRSSSPRYLALQRQGLRGFELYVGWSLPELSSEDAAVLEAVAGTLGGADGWLAARLVRTRRADQVSAWFERRDSGAWFGVEISGAKRSPTKDVELTVLETLAVLEAHAAGAAPKPEGTRGTDADGSGGLSPAFVGRTVRRLLAPSSRGVVEVQPPDPPEVVRASKVPVRHVVEKGDTLTHIARKNGLDLDALVRLNGLDPDAPIHPGEELRVSDKRARRPKLYVVKQGDTLAKVARRFGVSQERLLEVNRMKARRIGVGQKLVLPP
jgi:LysM repeat protein